MDNTELTEQLDRFLSACRGEHDRDPDWWHHRMRQPPGPRYPRCAFCGTALTETPQ